MARPGWLSETMDSRSGLTRALTTTRTVIETTNRRSDFHALCSLHTSNKVPDESIGNKGVGFRSVFSLSDRVRVFSRMPDSSAWWGIELHWCLCRKRMIERLNDGAVAEGWKRFLDGRDLPIHDDVERPSFYFPLPLWANHAIVGLPEAAGDGLTTIVEIPLETRDSSLKVRNALAELEKSQFLFVGLRESKRDVAVRVCVDGHDQLRKAWPDDSEEDEREFLIVAWPPSNEWTSPELEVLAQMASMAEHAISRPRVALAWPKANTGEATAAKRYCYLPTLVDSPLGIDVHADFQLGIDRTTLKTEDSDDVGKYNRALLEVAAELHLVCCLRFLGYSDAGIRNWTNWSWIKEPVASWPANADRANCRHDLWRFLNPKKNGNDHQVRHLERLLFGAEQNWRNSADSCTRWAELAAKFFSDSRPLHAFDEFWEATKAWIDCNPSNYDSKTKTWKQWAMAMCDALRGALACVVPVIPTLDAEPDLLVSTHEPLPDRPGSGVRAERRLYIRRGGDDQGGEMRLPEALRRQGRLVTCYRFVDGINDLESPNPTGALQLDRAALLRELRQLPTNVDNWECKALAKDAEERGGNNLHFLNSPPNCLWRASEHSSRSKTSLAGRGSRGGPKAAWNWVKICEAPDGAGHGLSSNTTGKLATCPTAYSRRSLCRLALVAEGKRAKSRRNRIPGISGSGAFRATDIACRRR